jgi:hypothetical protein
VFTEVEEHHLAGVFIDLEVGADTPFAQGARPGRVRPQRVERDGIEPVGLAALAHGGQRPTGMHLHVGAGVVLHGADRAPATAHGAARFDDAGPQGLTRRFLGHEASGAHEAVAVGGGAIGEMHAVDHPVAIEGVVLADGGMDLVVPVAQVHAVEILGQVTDHLQVRGAGGPFGVGRTPAVVQVGVVGGQAAEDIFFAGFDHGGSVAGGKGKGAAQAKRSNTVAVATPNAPGRAATP